MAVFAGVPLGGPRPAEVVRQPHLVAAERAEPHRVRQHHQPAGPGHPQHLAAHPPRVGRRARRRWTTGRRRRCRRRTAVPCPTRGRSVPAPGLARRSGVHLARRRVRRRRSAGPPPRTPWRSSRGRRRRRAACARSGRRRARRPQRRDEGDGVVGQRAVEPGRVGLLEAELAEQPHRARQGGLRWRRGRWRSGDLCARVASRHAVGGTVSQLALAMSAARVPSDPLRAAAVLARHRAPSGRRQRDLPAADRQPIGGGRCRRHAAHRPLSGARRAARCSTASRSAAAAAATACTSWRGWRWWRRASGSVRCGGCGPTW